MVVVVDALRAISTTEEDNKSLAMMVNALDLGDRNVLGTFQSKGANITTNGKRTNFKIKENRSTGYSWEINEKACPSEILKIESFYEPPST